MVQAADSAGAGGLPRRAVDPKFHAFGLDVRRHLLHLGAAVGEGARGDDPAVGAAPAELALGVVVLRGPAIVGVNELVTQRLLESAAESINAAPGLILDRAGFRLLQHALHLWAAAGG